jgi:hypothetical protein
VHLDTVHWLGNDHNDLVAKTRNYGLEALRGSTRLSGRGATGVDALQGRPVDSKWLHGGRRGIGSVFEAHVNGSVATDGQPSGMSARDTRPVAAADLGVALNETMVFEEAWVRVTWVVPDRVEWVVSR